LAGLSFQPIDLPFAPPKFDLSLGLADRDGRLGGSIEYALDLFDRETVERWSGELVALIGRAMADPDRPALELAALDEAERRQLLADWSRTPRSAAPPAVAGTSDEALDAPANPLEQLSARLWSEVLGIPVERIGRRSSFFSLGGHSLLGAQLATRAERLLQVALPLRALFEQPTLEGFAAQIVRFDPQPGRAEKIARAVLRLQAMSGAQKEALRPVDEPVGV
jgi:syringomycin synthetase protein SyrE